MMVKIPKLFRLLKPFGLFKRFSLPALLAIVLLAFTILINGCWDRRELETLGLVQALGLDLAPDKKAIIVTTMIAIPTQIGGGSQSGGGGGGGGGETGVFTITMEAPTIYEAFNRINTTINREITLIQNSALLIGGDLAKQGVHKWIDTLVRFREMRRTMLLFICRGKASEIMKIKPKLEKNPSEYFRDLVNQSNRNGMFPITTVNDFISEYETLTQENYAPLLAPFKPKESRDENLSQGGQDQKQQGEGEESGSPSGEESSNETGETRIVGTAVFNSGKMVGTLNIYESQILQLITGDFREASMTINDPKKKGQYIAYRLLATTPPRIGFQSSKHGQEAKILADLKLEADILSIQSDINYTSPKNETLLGKHIAQQLKKRIQKVIEKAQKEYASDIFGFGKTARLSFITDKDWLKYHWRQRFPQAKISVRVKVDIRRVGVQFQPPKIR